MVAWEKPHPQKLMYQRKVVVVDFGRFDPLKKNRGEGVLWCRLYRCKGAPCFHRPAWALGKGRAPICESQNFLFFASFFSLCLTIAKCILGQSLQIQQLSK